MAALIAYFIRTPILTNVLILLLFGFGALSLSAMRSSFFPEMESDAVSIEVAYPGASPSEMEEGVVLKIEEELDGLDGVERVTSVSRENFASLRVESRLGTDMAELTQDVKNAVDRINAFPVGAERPVVYYRRSRGLVFQVALFGDTDLYNLKQQAERLRDELLRSEEISQVDISGHPDLELAIEVSEEVLRRHQLRFDQIVEAVRQANINITGGKLETDDEELLIRAWGRGYRAEDLESIVLLGREQGAVVRLGEVARVVEQWADSPSRSFYNGKPALILSVRKTVSEDILAIDRYAKAVIEDFNRRHPQLQAAVIKDMTVPLRQRLGILYKNGAIGLLLVIGLLGLFMNLRLAGWVALGIPLSLAGMFIVANLAGITLNVISAFGMIVVIGILVDDAIVVGENIYSRYEAGEPAIQAAINGTLEVIGPVTISVLTTVVAFMPFFFLDGFVGKFIWHMALVVVAALLFSLLEAFFILPAHLAHSKGLHPHRQDSALRQRIDRAVQGLIHRLYAPLLRWCMRQRWTVVALPLALLLVTVGMLRGGQVGITFFPFIDGDELPVNLTLVTGTQEAQTQQLLEKIEQAAWQVNEEFKRERRDGRDVIQGIQREIGSNEFGDSGSHVGQLTLILLDGEQRDLPSYAIGNRLRELVGPVHSAKSLSFGRTSLFGKPVALSLLGDDLEQLEKARALMMQELAALDSLSDISDSNQLGRREISLTLKPLAHVMGLSLSDIAGQLRQGVFGQEIQRLQRGRDELRVWVRYSEQDRRAQGQLQSLRISAPDGRSVALGDLVDYHIARGITQIKHLDKKREILIEANLSNINLDLPPILATIREQIAPRVLAQVPGVHISFEGQSRDQQKMAGSMKAAFPLALIAMFILIVLVFHSWGQALQIFSLIPLAVIGAVWGHAVHGLQLNTLSLYGIIALTGIVINDSVVLIDKLNRNLRQGLALEQAIYQAALTRFRPILLTTLTTVVGLAPLIMETSRQAQFLIPMAVSVAYGLLFATFLLLLVLPAQYLVINRLRVWFNSAPWRGYRPAPEAVEPTLRSREHNQQLE